VGWGEVSESEKIVMKKEEKGIGEG